MQRPRRGREIHGWRSRISHRCAMLHRGYCTEEDRDERHAAGPSRCRSETAGNPGLPADQGPARIRRGEAGADLAIGEARLSDPRRHSDHAAGGSPRAGVTWEPFTVIAALELARFPLSPCGRGWRVASVSE